MRDAARSLPASLWGGSFSRQGAAGALNWARAVRSRGAEAVDRETDRLEALLGEVQRLEPEGNRAA
jgi:hypothetical protein